MEIGDNGSYSLDMTKLREERRPLWMSPLGIESFADMLGGGGDIYSDRLVPEWSRFNGTELLDDEEIPMESSSGEFPDDAGFPPKSDVMATAEEAFRYVHSEGE